MTRVVRAEVEAEPAANGGPPPGAQSLSLLEFAAALGANVEGVTPDR